MAPAWCILQLIMKFTFGFLVLPLALLAGPFRGTDLTADAKWFMHVDYDAARNSVVGNKVLGITDDRTCPVPAIKAFTEAVGFDGRRDLLSFTAYGTGAERQAVAIIRHRGNNLKVGEYLKSKGAEPDVVDGVPVLGFACDPMQCRLTVAFPSAGIVVLAMSTADVSKTCAALDNAAVVASIPQEVSAVAGVAPLFLMGADVQACRVANPRAGRMAAQLNSMGMALSESSGVLSLNAKMTMADAAAAQAAVQMVEGAKAFMGSRGENFATWMESLSATTSGSGMTLSWSAHSSALVVELDKARERMQEWKKKRAGSCPVTGK